MLRIFWGLEKIVSYCGAVRIKVETDVPKIVTGECWFEDNPIYANDFPQQLPGPAQPAFVGVDPQQAVSLGPGNLDVGGPDSDDGAEINFLRLVLPQV